MGLSKPIAVLAYLWDIVHLHAAFFLPNLSLGRRRNAWGGARRQNNRAQGGARPGHQPYQLGCVGASDF